MNLGQIRERIENELQHAPTTTAWKNDVYNKINDRYVSLLTSEAWNFRLVEASLRLRADERDVKVTINNTTGYPVDLRAAGAVRDVRYHDMDALILRAADEDDTLRRFGRISGARAFLHWRQVMRLYDGRFLGGYPDPDLTPTQDDDVYLEAPVATSYRGVTYADCILRHDRYQLPYDCAQIVSIVDRDNPAELELVDRTRERSLLLNGDDTEGRPEAWLLDDEVECGPAPYGPLTATVTSAGFNLAAGTYRYFYVFAGKGCVSGPSEIIEATATTSTTRIVVAGAQAEATDDSYWRIKLWFREDNKSGVFRYLTHTGASVTSLTDTGATAPNESLRWDDRMATPRKTVRFWPRPSADQWVQVQYLKAPARMRHAQDVPELPESYHEVLVHLVVEELAARFKQPQLQTLHRRLAGEVLALMRSQELNRYSPGQLGSWAPSRGRGWNRTKPATMV